MNTEITKQTNNNSNRGLVFYDAECGFCRRTLTRWAPIFERRGFRFEPLQNAIAAGNYPVPAEEFRREMKLLGADGRWFGGAEAWRELWRSVWWLKPIAWLFALPGANHLLDLAYRQIAARRYCLGGACRMPTRHPLDRRLPLLVLPATVIALRQNLAPWVFMWLLGFAIYFGCKWLTLRDTTSAARTTIHDRLIYLICWPGMSLEEFVATPKEMTGGKASWRNRRQWLAAFVKTLVGAGFVWGVVRLVPANAWLIRGWLGMIGVILMLHFGSFHLLALTLRRKGFNARPNMNAPLLAKSLADFWGRRWNTAFNVLADRYGFRPLTPWIGAWAALVLVFVASGLLHELVITFPARAGYGLPTFYFLIQAAGLLLERNRVIRRRPLLNRITTWAILVGPVGCLFPPVFVHNVILPMLHAIGAF